MSKTTGVPHKWVVLDIWWARQVAGATSIKEGWGCGMWIVRSVADRAAIEVAATGQHDDKRKEKKEEDGG